LIKALLGSDYLGARIAGTRLLTQQQPGTAKAFDPWASKIKRADMLQKMVAK